MPFSVEVWGDYACFTRPEFKTERVSYDVMTPSAARGILDAIYWHPGLKWRIDRIQVCNPIQFLNVRRNEVLGVVPKSAKLAMYGEDVDLGIQTHTDSTIIQRSAMVLKDAHYIIDAHFDMTDKASPSDNPIKFREMSERRLSKGQCFHQPCLGCREFAAGFQKPETRPECPTELKGTRDLGWMLFDLDYSNPRDIRPMFFRAVMRDGVIEVPAYNSKEVRA